MPIETSCDGCGQKLRVQDVHAGKLARCPACNSIYRVPIPDGVQPQSKPTSAKQPVSQDPLGTIPLEEGADETPGVPDAADEPVGPDIGFAPDLASSPTPPDSQIADSRSDARPNEDLVETAYPSDTERNDSPAPASASVWRMRTPEGTVYGSVPQHEIDAWVREGRVSADCQLSQNEGAWFWADQMYPQLRPAPQATAAQQFESYTLPQTAHAAQTVRTVRSPRLPSDRGAIVLSLGIMGWVIVCPFISLAAWIMGASDLRDMNNGRMMRTNRGMTQVGRTLGMLHVILTMLFIMALIFFGM